MGSWSWEKCTKSSHLALNPIWCDVFLFWPRFIIKNDSAWEFFVQLKFGLADPLLTALQLQFSSP